jgi:hypothetical protein
MADEPKFPLDQAAFAPNDSATAETWLRNLEMVGPENVRGQLARLAGTIGPGAAVPIGTVQHMTVGFAQQWLAWHDKQKAECEADFRSRQIFWTRTAALAACTAAVAGAIGWAWTIFHK